ncbi:hypothetical protein [Natrinema pallidum]|uniref:Uncharacterized protein n=1 Tax=Natrinema pallidum TaxID=69527 RepID=A0A4P9THU8_9EURY|nr:hypothetical protein [Natrinema pallidum]QCW04367.1 hypothetical protein FGF80_14505 [Natrinema pallidum]
MSKSEDQQRSPPSTGDRLRFSNINELQNQGEALLKHRYGRGIYIQKVEEIDGGKYIISLGNSVPKDLSDSLEKDGVIKFLSFRNIYNLEAEPTNSHYIVELPDREEIYEGFQERRENIVDQLDYSVAKSIYKNVLHFGEVENQLTPIRQILRWTHERGPVAESRINANQNSNRTIRYLEVLEELGYIRRQDGEVHSGERMDSGVIQDILDDSNDDIGVVEALMGDLVQRGYHTLRDRCDLRMLSHYPQFAGAYYYDAVQRGDSDLHLDMAAVRDNLNDQYNRDFGELYIDDKMAQLSQVDVIEKDGNYVTANDEVFSEVSQQISMA